MTAIVCGSNPELWNSWDFETEHYSGPARTLRYVDIEWDALLPLGSQIPPSGTTPPPAVRDGLDVIPGWDLASKRKTEDEARWQKRFQQVAVNELWADLTGSPAPLASR